MHDYERDPAEIYRQSFATIRGEADFSDLDANEAAVALRVIHACGMTDIVDDLVFSPGAVESARAALKAGAPVLCDVRMVAEGIIRARLVADNAVVCSLYEPEVPALAKSMGTTQSAAALELWRDRLDGAVVAIGNAPTALFRLLEILDETDARPAAVLGFAVGFVGAVESKDALIARDDVAHIAIRGRRGGSAMAAACVNALAGDMA